MQAVCPACEGEFCDDPPPNGGRRRTYCSARCRKTAAQARYQRSAKGKATQRRFQRSRLGRAAQRRYQTSEKGRTAHLRYLLKQGVRVGSRGRRTREERLQLLRSSPAYRELIRQRVSAEQKRRYHHARLMGMA